MARKIRSGSNKNTFDILFKPVGIALAILGLLVTGPLAVLAQEATPAGVVLEDGERLRDDRRMLRTRLSAPAPSAPTAAPLRTSRPLPPVS